MKESKFYKALFTGIIYLFLVGQVWVNIDSFCSWMDTDKQSELFELSDIEDGESEEELEKKMKGNHFNVYAEVNHPEIKAASVQYGHREDCFLSHHAEIQTPPPRVS